ncbi:MAG: right-handed parallel beta-helix repeat-containing protein, partial [Candidatus Marinimicrobia bacterium]|nr:right-handed parallel beta-helix repeat-containing protein [Candidatus Neomarinimicrobiota bacterium]
TYVENINFNGKNIVVGSLFLTTQDTSYISTTIIDGNQNGSVVTFESGEDSSAKLIGMTLTNGNGTLITGGSGHTGGGGVYCYVSSPSLIDLKINNNNPSDGGGLFVWGGSPIIENCKITYNSVGSDGGGICLWDNANAFIYSTEISHNYTAKNGSAIYIDNSNPILSNLEITHNNAPGLGGIEGGTIYLCNTTVDQIVNCTIAYNNAYYGGFILSQGSTFNVINTISWNDSDDEIYYLPIYGSSNCDISYTDIRNGQNGIRTNSNGSADWMVGNIEQSPHFVDSTNANFHLSMNSPCIDSGDPDLDGDGYTWETDIDDQDPDGTRMDMGAYYYHQDTPYTGPKWHVSIGGSNSNDGSEDNPFATIQYAVDIASAGDTVMIASGIYTGLGNRSIYVSKNVLIIGENRDSTIIDCENGGRGFSFYYDCSLKDLTIVNGNSNNESAFNQYGGGILIIEMSPNIENILIKNCNSPRGGGIGIMTESSSNHPHPTIINSVLIDNSSNQGGGIYGWGCGGTTIVNCLIAYNNSTTGGGIELANLPSGSANIVNCTIANNTASGSYGGISTANSIVRNSILWNNSPSQIDGIFNIYYSDVQGLGTGSNINTNPLFLDPSNRNYYLQYNSSCIDFGDPDLDNDGATWETDPDDQDPDGTRMDMGAYYYHQYSPNTGPLWFVSTTGSDDNDGSEDNPFATIQFAIDIASTGDTVMIDSGTYVQPTIIVNNKTITMVGDSTNKPILSETEESNILLIQNNGNAAIYWFVFKGYASNGIVQAFDAGLVNIFNCDFEDLNVGIRSYTSGGSTTEIESCYFSNCWSGVYALNTSSFNHFSLSNSIINYCTYGIKVETSNVYGSVTNSLICHNEFGIYVYNTWSGVNVSNSILAFNQTGYEKDVAEEMSTIQYSCLWNTTNAVNVYNNNCMFDNPMFCAPDSVDFVVEANSPMLNNGENGTNIGGVEVGCETTSTGPVWHITITGSDATGDGSELSPFATIQHGIDQSDNTDTVLVYPGTYVENINFNGKNIVVGSLFLTTLDTSYISSTIIDGNQNGSVVTFDSGEDSTAVLCGFTIENGQADDGGGIYCSYSNPSLLNLIVTNNIATSGGGDEDGGGGIYIFHSSPIIRNCKVLYNTGFIGGGIHSVHSDSEPTLYNVIIKGNTASYYAGGMAIYYGSNPSLNYVTIDSNTALRVGGGMRIFSGCSPSIKNSIIKNNVVLQESGGGIATYINCNPTLENVKIINNSAPVFGGGLSFEANDTPTLNNVLISGNSNVGMHCAGSSNAILNNVTITNNTGQGGISLSYSNSTISNSIIYNNYPSQIEVIEGIVNPVVSYSIIQGGYDGTGNIDLNPIFTNATSGDFRLSDYSPAIGAGTMTNALDTDLEGNPRPNPAGSNPDMGAYENSLADPLHNSFIHVAITGNDTGSIGLETAPFASIQAAIDYSVDSDTIIVQPGTYVENINYNGKNIVLGSLFLTTQDTSYISSTIIDGNQAGRVITIDSCNASELIGIIIRNGLISINTGYESSGGGMSVHNNANAIISNCIFENNYAPRAGGLSIYNGSHVEVLNCDFIQNGASIDGGAIFVKTSSNALIQNSRFINNGRLEDWSVSPNRGGALSVRTDSEAQLINCLIKGNQVPVNGIIYCRPNSTVTINSSTIINNYCVYTIYLLDESSANIYNSIIRNNCNAEVRGEEDDTITINYSNIEGDYFGIGNIDIDPLFVGSTNDNYSLSDYSTCIGTGTDSLQIDSTWHYAHSTDIEGNTRPNPAGSQPDMGAYENVLASQLPLAQSIRDGFGDDVDITNSPTTLTANWDPFIDDSTVTFENAVGTAQNTISNILEWTPTGTDTFAILSGLNLSSGTTYYVSVRGTDIHNQLSDTTTTDGILVDLVNPLIGDLWDGDESGDIDWQNSTDSFSIYWTGSDSRIISRYEYSLGTSPGDSNTVDWAENGTNTEINILGLALVFGITYYANVRAIDDAGNYSDIATTNGCTVDTNLPIAGTVNDFLVYSGSGDTLYIAWTGFSDEESTIDHYQYALGTTSGGTNTVYWTVASLDSSRTISGLNLSSDITYYASVKAIDLAGNWSSVVSSDGVMIDLDDPVTGIVNDGDSDDSDWSNLATSISGNWSGFSDGISGIAFYEYAVGISPSAGDIIDWTLNGTATSFDSSGLILTSGTTYYISVRARDNVGNMSSPSSSDGVLIDLINPLIGELWDGNESGDVDWQTSANEFSIYWTGSDSRVIANYQVSLSSTPGDSDVVDWTDNGTTTSVIFSGLNLSQGETYYANVRAMDEAKNWSGTMSSDGVTIDGVAPVAGQIFDDSNGNGIYYAVTDSLALNWSDFYDEHSGIDHYEIALGTNSGSDNVFPWDSTGTDTVYAITDLSLSDGTTYYASVRAVDLGGNLSLVVSTDGLTIDVSGPVGGAVTDGLEEDVDWSNNQMTLSGHWGSFTDDGIGLDYYEYSLGTEAGLTDLKNWTSTLQDTSLTVDNAGLPTHGNMYYLNVRAFDEIGNMSEIFSSDGVTMDIVAPVVSWLNLGGYDESSDYCGSTDSLRVSVSLIYDELSGFKDCQFALGTAAGFSDIAAWATGEYLIDDSVGYIDLIDLTMIEGISYYGAFRAYDLAGNYSSLTPVDGIIPDVTAPENGIVNDGNSMDIGYSNSDSTVYGNWIDFSDPLSGISYYRYGLGTEQILDDVVSYTNTPFTAVEILNLSLTHGEEYFLSVKAVDIVGNISEPVSSDGIVVDIYAGPPLVLNISPDPVVTIPTNSELVVLFELSEPINDDYSYSVASHDNSNLIITPSYNSFDYSVSLNISGISIYADTITVSLNKYIDFADLGGDTTTIDYYTPFLADFNKDWIIDILDLSNFANHWNTGQLNWGDTIDGSYELGPITGDVPYFTLIPDSVFNIRDVMAFTRMWNWSHQTQAPALIASGGSFGEPPIIEQNGRSLFITLPEWAEAGQIVVEYQSNTTEINCSTEDGTTNRILLRENNVENSQLLVEYAYISNSSNKSITLDAKTLSSDNSTITVFYTLYSEKQEILSRGSQDIELIAVPDKYALHQNYPNPFNPITTIEYDLPENAEVFITIYDILGREVKSLVNTDMKAGYHVVQWNGTNRAGNSVSAGMYLYRISAGDFNSVKKMVLLK